MSYRVIWRERVRRNLHVFEFRLLHDGADTDELNLAAAEINSRLSRDPAEQGESRSHFVWFGCLRLGRLFQRREWQRTFLWLQLSHLRHRQLDCRESVAARPLTAGRRAALPALSISRPAPN